MNKIDLLESLSNNLKDLNSVEDEISIVQSAIYKNKLKEAKEKKINEIENELSAQAKIYNQNISKYKNQIEEILKIYEVQIDKLINIYDSLYINVFKKMESARVNQKIAVTNIISVEGKLENNDITEEQKKQLKKCQIAYAQRKINYSVIIDECEARINWCIENAQINIDKLFVCENNKIELYKDNIFTKIRKMIFNKISGKIKYKKVLSNYKEIAKNNKDNVSLKILEVASVIKGFLVQMEKTKAQIVSI
jgi:hypothetical protein